MILRQLFAKKMMMIMMMITTIFLKEQVFMQNLNLTHISFSFIYFVIMFSDISIGSLIEPALK